MDKQNSKRRAGAARKGARAAVWVGMAVAAGALAQSPNQDTRSNQSTNGQASPSPSASPPSMSQTGESLPNPAPNQPQNSSNQSNRTDRTDQMQNSQQGQQGQPQGMQPDNTGQNKADRPTAEDQGNSPQDREISRRIRRELMQSNDLSISGKNVKVITENGKVTIRGPVNSDQEKAAIAAIAERVAGQGNVTDQLEAKKR